MARSRQRRKQRQRERKDAPINGGVAPELHDEADAEIEAPAMPGDREAEQVTVTGPGDAPERSFAEAEAETFEDDVSAAELIGAIGPLRRTRRHPLLAGIRMFTAMLEEARGGYAADRLAQMEEALALDFNALEQEGILQIAMAAMDDSGVPDVEHGVRMALEARAEVDGEELLDEVEDEEPGVAEDRGDEEPASTDDTYEPQTEEGRRLAASGVSQEDVEAMDAQVLEAAAATAEEGEDPDPDAPGPDEQ